MCVAQGSASSAYVLLYLWFCFIVVFLRDDAIKTTSSGFLGLSVLALVL